MIAGTSPRSSLGPWAVANIPYASLRLTGMLLRENSVEHR
jgi:hypothetical protein